MAAFENGTGEGNEYFRNNIIISKKIGHIWLQFLKFVFCKKKNKENKEKHKVFYSQGKQTIFVHSFLFYFEKYIKH